ncbi:DUF916 and DUF3324 domain-containing protein [Paenibacillus thiaminolyticus]|uniref:DUF916 and DUF3324 domain-containing protein n=1 Tax=Paenibacillus thiaminolyticus TaxID=49283 RepID=UPI00254325BF|nr:DUF916 and DUF3324 domain-containing protein [Paenibacillus thiaminolyticus]WII37045.1 DUF916 and DUF3324 domain-containing protein [Paenibacillus thiaminolyticus]
MKKGLWMLIASLWVGLGLVTSSDMVFAGTMNYSVKANIPENQINKNLTYFDLKMSPGSKQTISLTVKNGSTEPIELMIEPNTAITNQNGVIDYSKHEYEKDSSLKYAFSDLISPKQKVTLQGNETKEVPFTIQMPEESYDGVILGGFYIYKINQADEPEDHSQVQLKNEFSYVIGVKLTETENTVQPELELNEVQAGLMNYRPVVTANLQNIKSVIVSDLEVGARITKEGHKETLYETKKSQMSMAPNSNFDFPIRWEGRRLEPGKYHLYLTATDGNQTWEFDSMFEIKSEEAKVINQSAVAIAGETDVDHKNTLLFLGMGAIIAALVIIIVLLLKKKREETNGNDERKISSS